MSSNGTHDGSHAAQLAGNGAVHVRGSDEPGLLDSAKGLWGDVRAIAHDHLQLAALEAQRASRSLIWLLVYGILLSVLLLSAWAGTIAALVLWLVASGLGASAALMLAALINIIAAGLCVLAIRRRSRHLGFPATLRSLERGRGVAAAAPQP